MSNDGNKHDSGLARFFSKFDLVGKLFGGDDFMVRQADSANKVLHKVAKKDPFIRMDRQHGVGSWGGAFGKVSDWAYDHPADATAIALTAGIGGAAAGGAAGAGGGGTAAGVGGAAAGTGAAATGGGISGAIGAALPTVTVTGSTGAGTAGAIGAGAAAAGGAAAASNASTSSNGSNSNKWGDLAKKLGGQMMQQGQSEEDKMLEMLARQGPPPQLPSGGNLSPVPVDQYQEALTPTPQKVFG